jgi:hypothetical protein
MTEAPRDAADPERDLLEEMHSALGLAEERERRPKEEMDRLRRLLFGMLTPPSLARQGSRSA